MSSLSRRDFIKLGGAAALGLAFNHFPGEEDRLAEAASFRLGRVVHPLVRRERPSVSGRKIDVLPTDELLTIAEQSNGDGEPTHNPIWYRVEEGWVHSSFVQPVGNDLNKPILDIPEGGFLAEVTVPFTEAWRADGAHAYRVYYRSTHWVDKTFTDKQGVVWYRVLDDRYQVYYYALAEHLRRVPEKELTPLSPDVLDKLIEVDLAQQKLTAYENGRAVLTAPLSSGVKGWETSTGEFRVERKRPSRHMALGDPAAYGYDLPGIPWVAYFNWKGQALHGTYWHNDFGRRQSAGCVNLRPADAKWLFRWTLPAVLPGEAYVRDTNGTKVIIF